MIRTHSEIFNIHQRSGRYGWMLLVVVMLVALSGCGTIDSVVAGSRALIGLDPKPVQPDWRSVAISAADDANANSALAVDVVLVKDKAVLDTLLTMPASKWFTSRQDLQRTFPEAFTVYQYEMVPTQAVRLDEKTFGKERAWAAFVFANYAAPGEHRARLLLNNTGYSVQLNAQSFAVSEFKAGAAQ